MNFKGIDTLVVKISIRAKTKITLIHNLILQDLFFDVGYVLSFFQTVVVTLISKPYFY